MPTARKRRHWIRPEVKAFLAALAVILTGSWASDELRDWIAALAGREGFEAGSAVWAVPAFGLMVLSVFWLYRLRKVWTHPRTRLRQDDSPPTYPNVVLFLSNLVGPSYKDGVPEGVELTGDLDADIRALEQKKDPPPGVKPIRWVWEMPLRGLAHHREKLQRVVIVCSRESLGQVHWFGRLIRQTYSAAFKQLASVRVLLRKGDLGVELIDYPPDALPEAGVADGAWDFEAFDQLSWGMVRLLDTLKGEGVREQQIVVDFTSGQKVNSVVGASVTMNRDVTSQYVRTSPPHQVIHYDLVLTSMDDLEP